MLLRRAFSARSCSLQCAQASGRRYCWGGCFSACRTTSSLVSSTSVVGSPHRFPSRTRRWRFPYTRRLPRFSSYREKLNNRSGCHCTSMRSRWESTVEKLLPRFNVPPCACSVQRGGRRGRSFAGSTRRSAVSPNFHPRASGAIGDGL